MNNRDFKGRDAVLTIMNEKPQIGKINWGQIIYFTLLIIIIISLFYYFGNKLLYVRANGQVICQNTEIRLDKDSRIIAFKKQEGEHIHSGDPLFTYIESTTEKQLPTDSLSTLLGQKSYVTSNNPTWLNNQIYDLEKKITINTIEINEDLSLQRTQEAEYKKIAKQVALEALPYSRLETVKNQITNLRTTILKLTKQNTEFTIKVEQIKKLVSSINTSINLNHSDLTQNSLTRVFYSPVDGITDHIFLNPFETALKSDVILTLQCFKQSYIKAYFEQEDLKNCKEGDVLNLQFPDGTSSKGYIKHFYLATSTLPEEFQERYAPVKRVVVADVYPINKEQATKWRVINKLTVKLSKFKY